MNKAEAQKQREQLEKYLKWVKEEGGIENPTHLSTMMQPEQLFRLQWLKQRCTGKIMELGTCYGFVLAFCSGHIGIDHNEKSIELARVLNPEKRFRVADIRKLPFKNSSMDTVMLPDVLEHIPWADVPKVLAEAFRVARRRVLITIPDNGSEKAGCFKHQWLCTVARREALLKMIPHRTTWGVQHGFVLIEVGVGKPRVKIVPRIASLINRKPAQRHVDAPDLSHKVDFFASRKNYVDHLEPIYKAMPEGNRGYFIVNDKALAEYTQSRGIGAIVTSIYQMRMRHVFELGWLVMAGLVSINFFARRKLILLNHGCGGSWNVNHQSYAGGNGTRRLFKMIIEPGEIPAGRDRKSCPDARIEVAGCPRMDRWYPVQPKERGKPPVVAIGFHQDTGVCPESRTALPHYLSALPRLAKWQESGEVKIIGTGHPVYWRTLLPLWEKHGFEPVMDFDEVMKRADVYVRDQYSTIYEFASLDRPVVLLNAPWYRRNVEHGMRFWELSNVGINVNEPGELIPAIKKALADPPEVQQARREAAEKVYKYMDGKSTERAVQSILSLVNGR